MVDVNKLCQKFKQALAMNCPYVSPGNTTMDTISRGVDCSGLFCAAFKSLGGEIYHGSNTIYRQYLTDKGKLTSVKQLFVGAAVFKWSPSGEPSKYVNDGIGNMQHIGFVVSVNPLKIIHASSAYGKVTQDTSIGKWAYWGRMKNVDYNTDNNEEQIGEIPMNTNGILVTKVTLNIREGMGTSTAKIGSVPSGTELAYTGLIANGWVEIEYKGIRGFICSQSRYVTCKKQNVIEQPSTPQVEEPSSEDDNFDYATASLSAQIQHLLMRIEELEDRLDKIENR